MLDFDNVAVLWVCPHCTRETVTHRFYADSFLVETHHCQLHGDIVPRAFPVAHALQEREVA